MKFSIVTPSFNQLSYLKRCAASVADQEGVEVEHIVVDGGSTDGTVEWLTETVTRQPSTGNYQLSFVSEDDEGMYDALNKGFDRASGEFFAWLNCDEQYLLGVLKTVADVFEMRPRVDFLCGDALVVDPTGALLGFWKSMPLRKKYLDGGYLYNLSCAMFFRKTILGAGMLFDASFKAVGDQELVVRLLQQGARSKILRKYFSAYTFSLENLSEHAFAKAEREKLRNQRSRWDSLFRPVFHVMQRGERLLRGCRRQKFPLGYSFYLDNGECRKRFISGPVSSQWPGARSENG